MSEDGTTIGDLQPEAGSGGGLWRLPVLALGGALLVGGAVNAFVNRPAPDHRPALREAAQQLSREDFRGAISTLNKRVFPYLAEDQLSTELAAEYHLLLGRALVGGQGELDVRVSENDQNVVAQYLQAERLGVVLDTADQARLADAYIALGRFDDAERRVDLLPETDQPTRERLIRNLVEARLDIGQPRRIEALEFLSGALTDPKMSEEHRLWSLARQAEVRLALGFPDETVNQLLRELPLLQQSDPEALAELYLWLGRAYFELDALREADRHLARADSEGALAPSDPRRAMARLYLARSAARQATDQLELEAARDRFAALVDTAGGTPAYLHALLGLGDMEAALGEGRAAIEAYGALVEEVELRKRAFEELPIDSEGIAQSLVARYQESAGVGDSSTALEYASLAGDLFTLDEMPPTVIEALGGAHEARAEALLGDRDQGLRLRDLNDIDPGRLQQIKRHLIQAAGFFRTHADRYILDEYDVYADSLWRAAGLYDRAGDTRATVTTLTEFTEAIRDDARRAEGRFILAQAQQSLGQYGVAAELYRGLIADRASNARDGVGVWADRSHVPLAQSLLLDGDSANDTEAEDMLLAALDGRRGGPDRAEYRDALFELGRVFDRSGRHDLAIERLTELLERAPEDPRALAVKYRLADNYRRLADQIEERLPETMRQSQVRALKVDRVAYLNRAIEMFEDVRDGLGAKQAALRTALEDVQLRNAYFYLGDCAFDLGEHERAIAFYSASRNRYPRDPAVLVALIQIVNAYVAMGDLRSARTANVRARDFYASLPDDVWDDPNLPMGRREWERWLDSSAKLYEGLASAG